MTAAVALPSGTAGYFALDREAARYLNRRYGETLGSFVIAVAALACRDEDDDRLVVPVGTVAELADMIGWGTVRVRKCLRAAEAAGLLCWERAGNEYSGRIVLAADLRSPDAGKPGRRGRHRRLHPPVDTGSALTSAVTSGVRETNRPDARSPISLEDRKPPTPANLDTGPDPSAPTGGDGISTDDLDSICAEAATHVCAARTRRCGPAGPGALRKAQNDIRAAMAAVAVEWLADGHQASRIAAAIGARFMAEQGEPGGNRWATPYDRADLDALDRDRAAACSLCDDDGWQYDQSTRTAWRCDHVASGPEQSGEGPDDLDRPGADLFGTVTTTDTYEHALAGALHKWMAANGHDTYDTD